MIETFFFFFIKLSIFVLLLLVVAVFLLYKYQNKILYIPVIQQLPQDPDQNPQGWRNPNDVELDFENLWITCKDGIKLHGWICKQDNCKLHPTVIYFHENAGNIGTRIQFMEEYHRRAGFNVVLVAYRGYSKSEGVPTEEGLKLDAEGILSTVFSREDINTDMIFIHGRSLGGAVGVYAAAELNFNLAGLIVENTFTSIPDMVDVLFSKIAFLKKYVCRNYWPSIDRIGKIKCPILFILAMKDELVPPVMMEILYSQAAKTSFKDKHIVPNGDHNNSWALDRVTYFKAIDKFWKAVCKK